MTERGTHATLTKYDKDGKPIETIILQTKTTVTRGADGVKEVHVKLGMPDEDMETDEGKVD